MVFCDFNFLIMKKKILLIIGIILTLISLFYFIRLVYFLINSYVFTNYGYGILFGKFIILLIGILFIYLGTKKRKAHNNVQKQ